MSFKVSLLGITDIEKDYFKKEVSKQRFQSKEAQSVLVTCTGVTQLVNDRAGI